jgi:hypothetical protein
MSLFSDAFEKIKENEFELLLKDFIKNEDYKDDPWCSEKYFDYTQCITRMKEELLALRQSVSKEEDNQKVQSYVDTYADKDFENNEIKSVFKDKLTKPINLSCRYTSDVWADGTPVTKMFHRNEEITLSLKENDYIEGIIFNGYVSYVVVDFYFRGTWYQVIDDDAKKLFLSLSSSTEDLLLDIFGDPDMDQFDDSMINQMYQSER